MGQNTFTVKLNTGATATASAFIEDVEITDGYWCSDKEAKNLIKYASLGDTVYFCATIKGLTDGEPIDLKLYEDDGMFWDFFDDDTFNEEEINKTAFVQSDEEKSYIIQELHLDERWENEIADDTGEMIELYWELSYKNYSRKLPMDIGHYLKVEFSTRNLFVNTPAEGYGLPELISHDGSPLIIVEYIQKAAETAQGQIDDVLDDFLNNSIKKIALAKLSKGSLVTNIGEIHTKNSQIYNKDIMFTNDGSELKDVKIRKNFGYKHEGKELVTTKGISQYDFFANNGTKVKLLGMLKALDYGYDIFNLMKFATEDFDISKPMALPLGALTPISEVANILITEEKERIDGFIADSINKDLQVAKAKGIDAVDNFVKIWSHSTKYKLYLEGISKENALKLVTGEITKYNQLNTKRNYSDDDVKILYKVATHPVTNREICIIDSIFLNY